MSVGVFSDSEGDLEAFDAAYELLRAKGATRFFFAGGRYTDLDEWISWKREKARGGAAYSDADFLADVSSFLSGHEPPVRMGAFGAASDEGATAPEAEKKVEALPQPSLEDLAQVKQRFERTPERGSAPYADPNVPKKHLDMIDATLCCLVHDKNDLEKDDMLNASVLIHGNEKEPKVVQIGPRFFVTPGRLKGAAEQTCGLIESAGGVLRFSAFRLDGAECLAPQSLAGGGKTKVTVK